MNTKRMKVVEAGTPHNSRSYDDILGIAAEKHLSSLRHDVIDVIAERAEEWEL